MLALIYDRNSTPKQAKNYSLESQLEANKKKAIELGATDFIVFEDAGYDGADFERPDLSKLRDTIANGIGDMVIIYDPDRMARKLSHQLLLTEEIEKAGLKLEFVNSEYKNTHEGKLFYAMRGAFAEYEKEKIKERTDRGKATKLKKGEIVIPPSVNYGYIWDKEGKKVLLHPQESETIKLIFDLVLTYGKSTLSIQTELFNRGILTKKGKPIWQRTTILRILHNEIYAGIYYQQKWETTRRDGKKYRKFTKRSKDEWVAMEVPAIISKEDFDKVQEILKEWANKTNPRKPFEYLLTGLMFCGICGKNFYGGKRKSTDYTYRYYSCRSKSDYNKIDGFKCSSKYVPHQAIDDYVWNYVKQIIENPNILLEADKQSEENPQHNKMSLENKMKQNESKLSSIKKNKLSLLNLKTQGLIDDDELTISLQNANQQIEYLNQENIAIQNSLTSLDKKIEVGQRLEELKLLINNPNILFETKKMIIREFIEKITVLEDGSLDIILKINQNFVINEHNILEHRHTNDKKEILIYKKISIK